MGRAYRRLRFGEPVVVVSGLPRSGTSMMMQMLKAGGLPIIADHRREADKSNPQGYFELERVKELDKGGDTSWLRPARGGAVKIIAYLLRYLPEQINYKVLFMRRDIDEVLVSQRKLLAALDQPAGTDDERMRRLFVGHLAQARRLLKDRSCFDPFEVCFQQAVADPTTAAAAVIRFLRKDLDVRAMAAAVRPDLYRNRGTDK